MLLKSLFIGREGSYNIFGFPVNFVRDQQNYYSFDTNSKNPVRRIVSQAAEACLHSRTFRVFSFGYIHTFVHEMGHALANKILTGESSSIEIDVNSCKGATHYKNIKPMPKISGTLARLAGPLADIIFSVGQIAAAVLLAPYLTVPVSSAIVLGASIWIVGELFYAAHSTLQHDHGDFGQIARTGQLHLAASTAALVCPIALGILALSV